MLNFSCADFTFPVLERTAALKLVKLLGFDHVDIGLFARSSHFSPGELQASPRQYTMKVLSDLSQAELKASDIFLQIGVDPSECAANDPSSAVRSKNRDTFANALDICVALGCRHLTGLPGVFHSGVSQDRDFHLAEEEASLRARVCASAGVAYAIEPHVGSICSDVTSTRAFLRRIEGLTLTLDYGHFVMAGESSEIIHTLLPFASHVHVRGGALDRLQTSLDENAIDFTGMINGLKRLDYAGFLTLEYVWVDWKGCNRTDNVSETILLRRALETVAN
jgi:sugar phosphate isomerase/epimerase